MENKKCSESNYKHKSGYTKRKLKLERELYKLLKLIPNSLNLILVLKFRNPS